MDNAKGNDQEAVKLLADAVLPTLRGGDAQLGLVVTDAGKGKLALTAAVKTVDGKGIEKTAKTFAAMVPKEHAEFTVNADTAGERNIHKLKFASADHLPFASDTLWLLTGDDLLAVHTDASSEKVKAIGRAKAAKAPMLALEMSWVRFARATNTADADAIKNVVESVFETDKTDGLDTLKITATGGKQLTLNVAIKGKAVAFLAAVNKAK